jgi:hypothetical protein
MDNYNEKTLNLHNKLPIIPIYSVVVHFEVATYSSMDCYSSITLISLVWKICYDCTYYYASIMVCVWPLSPSSCEVGVVVVVTDWVDGNTSTIVVDFMWVDTCCAPYFVKTSIKTFSSNCATIYSSTDSFVVSPPFSPKLLHLDLFHIN